MRKHPKGAFIVVEGVNGAGKTSMLEKALPELEELGIGYNKGFTSTTAWGIYINDHPSSLAYYLDFAWKTQTQIIPQLRSGHSIVQDRYVQSVDSFPPDCTWQHNKIIRSALSPLFLRPDIYIHVHAESDVIAERLQRSARDSYRLGLAKHPEKLTAREENYLRIYEALECPKHLIDTTGKTPTSCSRELIDIIRSELP